MEQHMTVKEAAQELGVTVQAVRLALARETLSGRKFGNVWMVNAKAVKERKKRKERKEAAA